MLEDARIANGQTILENDSLRDAFKKFLLYYKGELFSQSPAEKIVELHELLIKAIIQGNRFTEVNKLKKLLGDERVQLTPERIKQEREKNVKKLDNENYEILRAFRNEIDRRKELKSVSWWN